MTLHKQLDTASKDDPHPEQPTRITGIFNRLSCTLDAFSFTAHLADPSCATVAGLTDRMERISVREVVRDEVMLVHSEGHWDRVRATGCTSFCLLATSARF